MTPNEPIDILKIASDRLMLAEAFRKNASLLNRVSDKAPLLEHWKLETELAYEDILVCRQIATELARECAA